MSSIYHFGDSYGRMDEGFEYPTPHFVDLCARELGYEYVPNSHGGLSNEIIFSNIIKSLYKFKRGDIIFINWSFFVRGSFWNWKKGRVDSTNMYYYEMGKTRTDGSWNDDKINRTLPLIEYYLNYTEDYNRRVFELVNPLLKFIIDSGINVYYIFVDDSEYVDDLIKYGTSIKFPSGFGNWLKVNGLHKEQDAHYTRGIQPALTDMILNKTNRFTLNDKIINCDSNDFNRNLILKNENLL